MSTNDVLKKLSAEFEAKSDDMLKQMEAANNAGKDVEAMCLAVEARVWIEAANNLYIEANLLLAESLDVNR